MRDPSNLRRALPRFHTPAGLLDLLARDKARAEQQLESEPYGYLKLRDYQQSAIAATEHALSQGVRTALLAMATGTGKTRTVIGLMYRFLKAERFNRILFLVDRTALICVDFCCFFDMSHCYVDRIDMTLFCVLYFRSYST